MKNKRVLCLVLAVSFLISGCNKGKTEATDKTDISGVAGQTAASDITTSSQTETTASEPFEFNPHVYSGKIAERIPQDYWDAFYNLCDALRKGEDTFGCSSQEAYNWATDVSVLCDLFPPAGAKIEGKSTDGSPAYENGTGKIHYNMPVEDFLKRESDFEVLITDILNSTIEKDDTEYERALKLYLYVAKNYVYDYSLIENLSNDENYVFACFKEKKGQCVNFASVYAYLLLQAGIDAVSYRIYEDLCHAWTYAVIDGKGYHIDTTWALQADGIEGVYLDYFMMSDKERIADGCTLTDDEEKKIVHYTDLYGEPKEFCYGEA